MKRWPVWLSLLALPAMMGAQTAAEFYKSGRAAYDAGSYDVAIKSFEKSIQLDDKIPDYHLWLARALGTEAINAGLLRQPTLARRAKSEFERTIQLDPKNVSARDGLLQFYLHAPGIIGGNMSKARELAEEIARLNPLRGHIARSELAAYTKDQVTVEREDRLAVTEYPDSGIAVFTYASWLGSNNRADEAVAQLEHFLTRRPGDPTALVWIGRVAAVSGKHLDRGEQALRQALTEPNTGIDPNVPAPAVIHFRLGEVLSRKGDKEQARKEFEMALRLNPKLDAAKRSLKAP